MASINGISIKKRKDFLGHEEEPLSQGDLYLNGKKLGFFSQDFRGGPNQYQFDENVLNEAVKSFAQSKYVEEKYKKIYDLDCLIGEILQLMDDEKQYKKEARKGYDTMMVLRYSYFYSITGIRGKYHNEEEARKVHGVPKIIDDFEKQHKKENVVKLFYTSLDDFNISTMK
jgi:hypothetical protein